MKIKHNNTENTYISWQIHNQQKAEKNTKNLEKKNTKTPKKNIKKKTKKNRKRH